MLGTTQRDRITGFCGVVTAVCDYSTGPRRAMVQPPVKADGSMIDAEWFDVDRLEPVPAA